MIRRTPRTTRTPQRSPDDADSRKTSKLPAPPGFDEDDDATQVRDAGAVRAAIVEATGAPSTQRPPPHKPPTPIAAQRAIRLGVPPDRVLPRHGSSPTLVSAGNEAPPPSSEPHSVPLERQAELTAEDIARVDRHAARHGITREAMLAILADNGRIQVEARVERRWHELLATAQAQGKLAQHCARALCMRDGFTVGPCPCECEGCARIKDLLAQAKREMWRGRE